MTIDRPARTARMQELRDDADMLYVQGHFAESEHQQVQADVIEDELRDLAYINACESDSPNSPDFENVLSAELLKLGIED